MRLDESILERRRNGFLAAVSNLKRFFVAYYERKLASQIRHGCLWEFLLHMRLDESILERRRNGFLAAVSNLKRFFVAYYERKLQSVWQSNWDQQTENKLHSVMHVLAPTVPSSSNRREQVILTRLPLGHTRLTHRHLLFGEPPPYCEICNVPYR
ncbi:hypothetical protein TNCT_655951 [Trichonephila clavata]|uniref:Uncharacterized protein n=1 Tax=Trichonephila clavata TaxID=2740835 RepID=A0A8X6FW18_TRICU|nr:hypothetical protein TNCT_655951 [Trichonephila clavata]